MTACDTFFRTNSQCGPIADFPQAAFYCCCCCSGGSAGYGMPPTPSVGRCCCLLLFGWVCTIFLADLVSDLGYNPGADGHRQGTGDLCRVSTVWPAPVFSGQWRETFIYSRPHVTLAMPSPLFTERLVGEYGAR
ncbi:unnamed protein product [Polarella glacialis]|uniref:Uncharacterized protein n=1 Tax=Polarella glacialis TaxID=89957 RepID=A0A813EW15_POLGL|nr:unnamed protein product [Polarella glacialis]